MMRKVILEGELGEKFGRTMSVKADSHQDILKCIDANRPGFRGYIISCVDNNTGFIVDIAGKNVEKEEDLLLPLKEGDVTITTVPAGSKSGVSKIFAAIAIATLVLASAGAAAGAKGFMASIKAGATGVTAAGVAVNFSTLQLMGLSIAANLGLAGIQQIMAPDPATDDDSPTNYLYSGAQQNVVEGDPVPILYGELRIPGRLVGLDIVQGRYRNNNVIIDSNSNDLILIESEMQEEYV